MIYAKPSTSLTVVFRAYLASDHVTPATGKTIAITISKNGGAFGNPNAGATNATELSSGFYKVTLDTTDTGTNGPLAVRGAVATVDDVGVLYYVGQSPADVTHLLGTAWLTPGTAGTPDVNAKLLGGTAQTGRDVGLSVLLSSGTGTGQLDFTSGVVKSNLAQILGTALTETAGQIAAAFKKFFDKATPTGTINSLPDAVAGANGGLGTVDASNRVAGIQGTTKHTLDDLNDLSGTSIASAVWNALTSGLSTVGSIGKLLVDRIDAAITSRMATFTLPNNFNALLINASGHISRVTLTDTLTTYTGNTPQTGDSFALANGANGFVAIKSDTAAILVYPTKTVMTGTVGNATAPSTTQFTPSALSPQATDADQYKGRVMIFDNDTATAALRGQATAISAASAAGLPLFTFTALTRAPVSGDTFRIV